MQNISAIICRSVQPQTENSFILFILCIVWEAEETSLQWRQAVKTNKQTNKKHKQINKVT